MCSNFGEVDDNMYGGGRHGADTKLVKVFFYRILIHNRGLFILWCSYGGFKIELFLRRPHNCFSRPQ